MKVNMVSEVEADQSPVAQMKAVTYLTAYILLSGGQIFFNKWILSSEHMNFPYPIALTTLHMIFSSILCFVIFRVFKLKSIHPGMSAELYVKAVVPIGVMFAMTLWFGNTAYLYISVSFAQMLKAIMPVAVFLIGVVVRLEAFSMTMLGIMGVISFGVFMASIGEVKFSRLGVLFQMLGVVGEASRLILIEILLKKRGIKFDPLTMMYYVSPCSAICLFLPWIFLERPRMLLQLKSGELHLDPSMLVLNSLCTFFLNVSVFLVIIHTSALTVRVASVVKDWLVVLFSAFIFLDTKLTALNITGYAIAILGVAMYNSYRQKPHDPSPSTSTQMAVSRTTEGGRRHSKETDVENGTEETAQLIPGIRRSRESGLVQPQ